MTREGSLVLDSYRLAQYAVQVPCYICSEANTFDAEYCRHCAAPMALAHQATAQNLLPRMLATIGPAAVGKTVYLGMLMDVLSRQPDQMQLLARGAFSINLQQTAVEALSRCAFPHKTPNEPDRWNWVHCQLRLPRQRRPVELIMPDLAGDALISEIEHPHTYVVIRALMLKSTGAMVLVDAAKLYEGDREQDYFTMKLLTYLAELDPDPRNGWANRPLAIVLTKADQCEECFDSPSAFAQRHAAGLWQHCQERFPRHRFFAAGVAGGCAYVNRPGEGRVRVPLRIEPRGIVDPFRWLVQQLKS